MVGGSNPPWPINFILQVPYNISMVNLSKFEREFRKQMLAFTTGAFTFVAALLWKDAIMSYLERYKELFESAMPIKEAWFVQFSTAILMSVVAVLAIMALTRFLKMDDK